MGGSSVVYAARDLEVGDEIALKVLRPDRLSEILVERSRREVGIARRIDDPRLVRVFSWIEHDGAICLAMELVEGETLRDRLAGAPPPGVGAVAFAADVLEASAPVHRREG